MATLTSTPFENIALTFSGGGYRAASFGLGILSYLNKLKHNNSTVLNHVKGLSTVSGGTITGVCYAISQANNVPFNDFYKKLYHTLDEDKLLSVALKILSDNTKWEKSHKKRSLINAFALAYRELFTDEEFGSLQAQPSHLEDVCFNATDFAYGLAFRFQTTGYFSNYRLKNTNLDKLKSEMKLADMIAASSCFPMGFEPIIMPDDFIENNTSSTYIALKNQKDYKNGVGLMDGGIVDNQGIGSIMKAYNRREDANKFGLIMVCDVGSYMMEPWQASEDKVETLKGSISTKQLWDRISRKAKNVGWLFIPLVVSPLLFVAGCYAKKPDVFYISGGAVAMLAVLGLMAKVLVSRIYKRAESLWAWLMKIIPDFIRDKLNRFENLKLRLVKRMVEERMTSGFKMINDIFLKQIRRLNYQLFYANDSLKSKRITNLIYELTKEQYVLNESDEKDPEKRFEQIPAPNDGIFAAARIASDMDTTLWFSEEDKKKERLMNLVTCGQFTACYNLLKYCIEQENEGKFDLSDTKKELMKHWNEFINDPYWLYDEYKKASSES